MGRPHTSNSALYCRNARDLGFHAPADLYSTEALGLPDRMLACTILGCSGDLPHGPFKGGSCRAIWGYQANLLSQRGIPVLSAYQAECGGNAVDEHFSKPNMPYSCRQRQEALVEKLEKWLATTRHSRTTQGIRRRTSIAGPPSGLLLMNLSCIVFCPCFVSLYETCMLRTTTMLCQRSLNRHILSHVYR